MHGARSTSDYYLAKAAEYRFRAQAAREEELQRLLATIALEFLRLARNTRAEHDAPTFH